MLKTLPEPVNRDLDFSSNGIDDYLPIDDAIESFEGSYPYKILNSWEDEIQRHSRKFRRYPLTFKYGTYDDIGITVDYSISGCTLGPDKLDLGNDYYASKIDVMKPEEILAEKVLTIYSRQKGRDLYDLYYLAVVRKTRISGSLIAEKIAMGRSLKGIRYSFGSFEERVEGLRGHWKDLDGILSNFDSIKFEEVKGAVLEAFRNV